MRVGMLTACTIPCLHEPFWSSQVYLPKKKNNPNRRMCRLKWFLSIFSVSTVNTYQVQYIQQGVLEIDTTVARWTHKTSSNGFMAYSYYGEIESKTLVIEASRGRGIQRFEI